MTMIEALKIAKERGCAARPIGGALGIGIIWQEFGNIKGWRWFSRKGGMGSPAMIPDPEFLFDEWEVLDYLAEK